MAKARQRAREERERLAAMAAAEREREAARVAARRERRARLAAWLPSSVSVSRRPGGVLAAKRATQVRMTVAILIAANVVVYLTTRDLRTVALTLVVSVLVSPVVFTMLHRRR